MGSEQTCRATTYSMGETLETRCTTRLLNDRPFVESRVSRPDSTGCDKSDQCYTCNFQPKQIWGCDNSWRTAALFYAGAVTANIFVWPQKNPFSFLPQIRGILPFFRITAQCMESDWEASHPGEQTAVQGSKNNFPTPARSLSEAGASHSSDRSVMRQNEITQLREYSRGYSHPAVNRIIKTLHEQGVAARRGIEPLYRP